MFDLVRGAAVTGLILFSMPGFAGEKEDALIDQTVAAYGGDALLELKTLRINNHYKSFREGQSKNPGEVDQVSYRTSTTIDYVKRRKSMQSFGGIAVPELYVQHTFFDGKTGYRVNHMAETAAENPRATFARTDRGLSWQSDVALVKLLSENRGNASYVGEGFHHGKPQQILDLQADGYPALTLYIDTATGLLSKMTRPDDKPDSEYSYVFSDYREQDGFIYAADTYVMRGGKPESLTASRSVEFNTGIEDAYQIPSHYGAPAKLTFVSEMTVKQLAKGVFHAGHNGAFSLFIDAGDYFIGTGGYPGLKERFDAVISFAKTDKPLKYQIVTHHHSDHIGGLKDAADMGATFIVAPDHVEAVRSAINSNLPDNRFLIAGKDNSYADGLVHVVDIASWHANHNLVTYVPHAKLAFSADHFFTYLETGAPKAADMYVEFKTALDEIGLDIKTFAAAHSGRQLTYDDLLQASSGPIKKLACPDGWRFCAH